MLAQFMSMVSGAASVGPTAELSGAAGNAGYEAKRTTRVRLSAGLGHNQPAELEPATGPKTKAGGPA